MRRTLSKAVVSASIGLLTVAALAGPALTATTVVVSDANPDGWTARHTHCGEGTSTGSQTMENGPATPPAGTGSREFRIGTDGNTLEEYRQSGYDGTKLADLTSLSYSTYVEQFAGDQAPYLILDIDRDGDGDIDENLIFEPVYQSEGFGNPSQGDVVLNTWQTWDALVGRWRVGPHGDLTTLADYIAANPNAEISTSSTMGGIRVATGCGGSGWANFIGNVDNVVIGVDSNETFFDFELFGPPVGSTTTTSTTTSTTTTTTVPTTTTSTTTAAPTTTTTSAVDACRPGNGYGDRNRCHSGPPGQTGDRPGQAG